jgi:hypothetical protein
MTPSDSQQPEPRKPEPDITFLPEVVAVEAALRAYRKQRFRTRVSELVEVDKAVEITVETAEPIPERALGPVLVIGRMELTESERIGPNRYRFYAYDFEKLKDGAPIRIGWFGQPRDRKDTGFRFELGENERPD